MIKFEIKFTSLISLIRKTFGELDLFLTIVPVNSDCISVQVSTFVKDNIEQLNPLVLKWFLEK